MPTSTWAAWGAVGGAVLSSVVGSMLAAADIAIASLTSARLAALHEQASGWRRDALGRLTEIGYLPLHSRYLLGRIVAAAATALLFWRGLSVFTPEHAWSGALLATIVLQGLLYEATTTLGRKYSDWVAPAAARWLRPLELALWPIAAPLALLGRALGRRSGDSSTANDPKLAEAEVEHMVDEVERSGLVGREPAVMIRNVLELEERTARDVMVPRHLVEGIDVSLPLEDAKRLVCDSLHSRFPVYKDQLDNVVGLLVAKDLFRALEGNKRPRGLAEVLRRNPNFVAESMPVTKLLREMRARRQHLAVVVDELGNLSGIVTLEDVLEEIVGDIRDEHDEAAIQDLGGGRWVADAGLSLDDVESYLHVPLAVEGEHESLGALLEQRHREQDAEQPVSNGFRIEAGELRFTVRELDGERVKRVEIERTPAPPPSSGAASRRRSERPSRAAS